MKDAEAKQLAVHKKDHKKRRKGDYRMVHWLVKDTAKDLAGAYYEHAAHDNQFYAYYPSQKFFIDYEWHRFIHVAKDTLTTMLQNPMTPEPQKQEIYHALVLDASVPFSYQETQISNFRH